MNSNFSDEQVLKRFGIKVPKGIATDLLTSMKQDPNFQKSLDKMMKTMNTMTNEDQFLQAISSSHHSISEIPENTKVIQRRDNTFTIRAINPQNIKSLTERAFFNSFNLQRNVLNDLDEQNKNNRGTFRRQQQSNKQRNISDVNRNLGHQVQEEVMCICSKVIPNSEWVECSNQGKCRGSDWYHIECAGFDPKQFNNLKDRQFTCQRCKREFDDDNESVSESRKRIKDEVSV